MPHRTRISPSTNELEQIRYALDQSAIVAITDVPGRIKYVNEKFCEISKYSRVELIGHDHRILNSGYHPKDFIRNLWRTIATGDVWQGEIRNRAKDGTFYWVDTTIVPFLDDAGKPWQYMAIRYDITQRKAQEQRLRDQAALTSLGELAAVVAHEVRNPLAGIRGGVQLLGGQLPAGSEGREITGEIVARIDALNGVVADLLTFARVRELKRDDVDLVVFLSDLRAWMRLDPVMQGIELTVIAPEKSIVEADLEQLRIVFNNLLINAAQAMSHRGRIEVTLDDANPEFVILRFVDNGPGIPEAARDRIFEPFFTTKSKGTGLGLPTAKRIIEAHGGALSLGPGPDGGTAATVTLPRHPPR